MNPTINLIELDENKIRKSDDEKFADWVDVDDDDDDDNLAGEQLSQRAQYSRNIKNNDKNIYENNTSSIIGSIKSTRPSFTQSNEYNKVDTIDDVEKLHHQDQHDNKDEVVHITSNHINDDEEELYKKFKTIKKHVTILSSNPTGIKSPQHDVSQILSNFSLTFLLLSIGLITGLLNGLAIWCIRSLLKVQAQLLISNPAGPLCIMITSAIFCALSSLICRFGNEPAAIGTGMPEVKALLATEFQDDEYPLIVSFKIQFIRLFSVILACGSCLSIGNAASLAHSTVCTAYNLIKYVPEFNELLENSSLTKQIFAAACAVGLTAVFNAPIGGLLFSIEVTSTYYLMNNYWNSFFCATVGAVAFSIVIAAYTGGGYRTYSVPYNPTPYSNWEYPFQALLGLIVGIISYYYLYLHQKWYLYSRPYIAKYPEIIIACVAALTALMIYALGAYNSDGMGLPTILKDLYNDGILTEMTNNTRNVAPIGGLIAYLVVYFILIMISTHHHIAWGVFLPDLVLGALFGRIFGLIVQACVKTKIYVSGYAMMGSVAFLSGTTHTTSAAVMIVEMTGQLSMLLPCLIVAVVASSVTKNSTLSLYDQDMLNKGMDSFQLLFNMACKARFAQDLIDHDITSIQSTCKIADLFQLLQNKQQKSYPVIDNIESNKLVGSLERSDIYQFLKIYFISKNLKKYIYFILPYDRKLENDANKRNKQRSIDRKLKKDSRFNTIITNAKDSISLFRQGLFHTPYTKSKSNNKDDNNEGNDVDGDVNDGRIKLPLNQVYGDRSDTYAAEPSSSSSSSITAALEIEKKAAETDMFDDNESDGVDDIDDVFNPLQDNEVGSAAGTKAVAEGSIDPSTFDNVLIQSILDHPIDIMQQKLLPLNRFPCTCHERTPMEQIYILFEMVKVSCVYVIGQDKKLKGMISERCLPGSLKQKMTN